MLTLLRYWRQRRGYSLRALGARAKVPFVTISRIENRHISPTVATLEKLAKALRISARDFFPASKRRHPKPKRR